MNDYMDIEFIEKLKEIYILVNKVLDIAPEEESYSDEMKEVITDIKTLRESFYLIEELIESDKNMSFIESLVALPDCHFPDDFTKAAGMLKRPYITLSEESMKNIENKAQKVNTDFLKDNKGNICTWGKADGIIHLMPIQEEYYDLIVPIKSNDKKSFETIIKKAEKNHNFNTTGRKEGRDILNAVFISVWDNGFCIETDCKVDMISKEVFDIKENKELADYVEILDREFVRLEDGREFNVEQDFKGDFYLSSMNKESVVDNIKKVLINNEGHIKINKNPTIEAR